MGKAYDEARDALMLEHLNPDDWITYRAEGCPQVKGLKLEIRHHDYFEDVVPIVIDDLLKGKIVGWVQGRFENGPRALGNRSLLLDPRNVEAAKKMSTAVKMRASFRPYAASITSEEASKVLDIQEPLPNLARWMQMVAKVRDDKLDPIGATLHVDRTTRPQVCSKEENPQYHQLLSAFGDATGVSALLNTSFNESGYPLVSSPVEALLVFARTNMDTIVINNLVVRKVE
jgi:carbamoyltransferase